RYRIYLTVLVRVQIGRRLQGKMEAADLIQETYLEAHRALSNFRGTRERVFTSWLRQILAATVAHQVRRYLGTKSLDVRRERTQDSVEKLWTRALARLRYLLRDPHESSELALEGGGCLHYRCPISGSTQGLSCRAGSRPQSVSRSIRGAVPGTGGPSGRLLD